MKTIIIIVHALSSIYFMGGALAQHPKAKVLLSAVEEGGSGLIRKIKDRETITSIRFLIDVFFLVGAMAFIGLIGLGALGIQSPAFAIFFSVVFISSLLFAGSLLWVFKHKEIAKMFWGWFLFFGLGSLSFPVMDILTNYGITHVVYSSLANHFGPLVGLEPSASFLYESLVVIGFYASGIVVFYLAGWVYSLPVAAAGWILVSSPIYLSRAVNAAFPEKPVVAIFFFFWLASFIALAYA